MGESVLLRSRSAQALGVAMMVVSAAGLVSAIFSGPTTVLQYAAPLGLFGLLGWAAFWAPHVRVTDGGVTVANTLRTTEVPWPAITGVDGRYGLRLDTAYGRITAWGAAAPVGKQRARRQDSHSAQVVSGRLEELRSAGFLEDARLERPAPLVTWHRPLVWGIGVLVLASVALPLLT